MVSVIRPYKLQFFAINLQILGKNAKLGRMYNIHLGDFALTSSHFFPT